MVCYLNNIKHRANNRDVGPEVLQGGFAEPPADVGADYPASLREQAEAFDELWEPHRALVPVGGGVLFGEHILVYRDIYRNISLELGGGLHRDPLREGFGLAAQLFGRPDDDAPAEHRIVQQHIAEPAAAGDYLPVTGLLHIGMVVEQQQVERFVGLAADKGGEVVVVAAVDPVDAAPGNAGGAPDDLGGGFVVAQAGGALYVAAVDGFDRAGGECLPQSLKVEGTGHIYGAEHTLTGVEIDHPADGPLAYGAEAL